MQTSSTASLPDQSLFIKMDSESFQRLSTYVTREYGIKLPISKLSMLESRLNKKVKSLGMSDYKQFLDYIFSDEGKQGDLLHVVDLITTNKTDFFREPDHFTFLRTVYLPQWHKNFGDKTLNIWSAGCSTGEEPYTLIMVLEEFKRLNPAFNYSILASDLSIRVIQSAYQGIYTADKTMVIPIDMKRRYFLKSKINPDLLRVKPEYRRKISYKRINLMDKSLPLPPIDFHIIFCRNVLIYFDKPTQESLIRKFSSHLAADGLLFLGHSESIMGMDVPLRQLKPTVYQMS